MYKELIANQKTISKDIIHNKNNIINIRHKPL